MYKRVFEPPNQSYFLFGPRGTGKTSLLQVLYPKAYWVNLLLERQYQQYLLNPDIFYHEIQALPDGQWIVVDEIQRLPELLNYIHQLIEEKRWKFVLTGSSARKLRKSGINLLAGRALYRQLFPFIPYELGNDFHLKDVLRYGCLPLIWDSEDRDETLRAYVETYFKQEIKEEALIKNLGGFSRFLRVAAIVHGQVLNISNVAREGEVARTTVNGFFEILEDTLLGYRLEAYSPKLRIREAKHSKFYFCDPGLVRCLKEKRGPVDSDEIGPLLEGFVLHLVRAEKAYSQFCDDIFYWQPGEATKTEVDFLLRRGSHFCAIEVKATQKVRTEDLKGLQAISSLKGLQRKILVYGGTSIQKNGDVEIFPVDIFAKTLREGLWG